MKKKGRHRREIWWNNAEKDQQRRERSQWGRRIERRGDAKVQAEVQAQAQEYSLEERLVLLEHKPTLVPTFTYFDRQLLAVLKVKQPD